MAFTTGQLTDLVEKAKTYLRLSDDSSVLQSAGLALYNSSGDATATVQVTPTTVVLEDVTTGTTTLTLGDAANDTLTELVAVINAVSGWEARLLGDGDTDSDDLTIAAATSALGQANEQTLYHVDNTLLELMITNVLKGIEGCLGRNMMSDTFSEFYTFPGMSRDLVLQQPDVTAVTLVSDDVADGLTVTYTGSDTNATVEVTDTGVTLRSRVGATTTTNAITFADEVTTTAMATAVSAVAGWTGSVKNAYPSAYLVRSGVHNAKDSVVALDCWLDTTLSYSTDYPAGVLTFDSYPWTFSELGRMRVDYTAGLSTVPADLEQAVLEAVKATFDATQRTAGVKSEKLGDYSYSMAETTQTAVAAGADAAATLSNYARLVVR